MIIEEFKILGTLPSVNGLLRGSKEYGEVKKKLTDIFEKNYKGYKLIDFAVSVEIYHYLEEEEYYKEDVDNKQKIIQDAMTGILIMDDSIIVSIFSEKKIAKSEEYFTVLIREYNETKNINGGEIIGSINSHQEREMKLRELQISEKDKQINKLIDENITKDNKILQIEKEIQDRRSEIIKLKHTLEERDKNLSIKSNSIDNHIRDKQHLKEENKNLLEEIEKLKQNVEEKEKNENIQDIEIEKNDVEFNENTDFFAYGDGTYHIDNYITNKASKEFIESVINEFDKKNFILKKTIKNKMSEIKAKKLIKDIYNIKLKSEGDKLIVNIN